MRLRRDRHECINRRGLSLVELLIAMVILSVAMLGVLGLYPVAHQHLRAGGDLSKATALAQKMVEHLRNETLQLAPRYHNADTRQTSSLPADDPGSTPPFHGGSALEGWRKEIASAFLGGELHQGWGRIEVTPLDRGLLAITVKVGWASTPMERTVQLMAYLGQH